MKSAGRVLFVLCSAVLSLHAMRSFGLSSGAESALVEAAIARTPAADMATAIAHTLVRSGLGFPGAPEWTPRVWFWFLTIATALTQAVILSKAGYRREGWLAALAYTTMPLVYLGGSTPNPGSLVQHAFALLFALLLLLEKEKLHWSARVLSMVGLGALTLTATRLGPPESPALLLESLAHRVFPWTGFVVLIPAWILRSTDESEGASFSKAMVWTSTSVLLLAGSLLGKEAMLLCAGPLAIGISLCLYQMRMERSVGLVGVFTLLVVSRDLAIRPGSLLPSFERVGAWESIATGAMHLTLLLPFALVLVLHGLQRKAWVPLLAVTALGAQLYWTQTLVRTVALEQSLDPALRVLATHRRSEERVYLLRTSERASSSVPLNAELLASAGMVTERVFHSREPSWLLFRREDLPQLNHQYRQLFGRNLPVYGDSQQGWLLTTMRSNASGMESPLNAVVRTEVSRENPRAVFGDRVALTEADVRFVRGSLPRSGVVRVSLGFGVLQSLGRDYQLFVHVDGPCGRRNGDHDPAQGRYPTRFWLPQDSVTDTHEVPIPWHCGRGTYAVWVGFFQGDRLQVSSGPHDGAHRVLAGRVVVE